MEAASCAQREIQRLGLGGGLGPAVLQGDGAVEGRLTGNGIFGVSAEVSDAFELNARAGLNREEGGLDLGT